MNLVVCANFFSEIWDIFSIFKGILDTKDLSAQERERERERESKRERDAYYGFRGLGDMFQLFWAQRERGYC